MDAKTLEALKASIAKWERNAEATDPDDILLGSVNCPLCDIFHSGNCVGCPVSQAANNKWCFGTPYGLALVGLSSWRRRGKREAFSAAARDEVAFLKSLLPEAAP